MNKNLEEAAERGKARGLAAAGQVFATLASMPLTAPGVLQGIVSGDPGTVDSLSVSWLSGGSDDATTIDEWAGESASELVGELLDLEQESVSWGELIDAQGEIESTYEEAAEEAYWHEIERIARLHLDGQS